MDFTTHRESAEYPVALQRVRNALKMTQAEFGNAAGHSGVMQGRYETDRTKRNSAVPSPKTANAIRQAIATLSQSGGATAAAAANPVQDNGANPEARSLKSVPILQIEQAIAMALRTLIGVPCAVTIKALDLSATAASGTRSEAAMSMVVVTGTGSLQ